MKLLRIAIVFALLFNTVNSYAGYTICQLVRGAGLSFADATTNYDCITGGGVTTNGSEADVQIAFRSSNGTFSKAGAYVTQNDIGSASTVALRVGGVTKALSVSITGNATGLFEDNVNSTTITTGNLVNWIIIAPSVAGTHSIGISNIFCRFLASGNTYKRLLQSNTAGVAYGSTTIEYLGLGDILDVTTTNEPNVQFTYRTAGTLQNGYAFVNPNTRTSATTISSRIGGNPGNIAVSVTANTTGAFEDLVNTDAVIAGDLVSMAILGTAGSNTGTFFVLGMEFTTTNNKSHLYDIYGPGSAFTAATTYYLGLTGGNFASLPTTEVNIQYKAGFAFTASNLQLYVLSPNGATGAGTFDFRIGGLSKNQSISITGSTSGLFEDTSDSDIVAQGNLVNYRFLVGSGGNTTISQAGCMIAEKAAQKSMAFILD